MPRRAVTIGVMVALLGGLLWLYLAKVFQIRGFKAELMALEAKKVSLESKADTLKRMLCQIDELQELAIRTRLRYGLPGELVVLFGEGR